jgi:hypothetical protein
MANATVLAGGQINGAGATDALFLKVYGGEVLTAFDQNNVVMPLHTVRTISSGKSAQFPATWRVTGGYHTPGTEIVGQTSNLAERNIVIDDLLVSSVFIADIDEAKSHFDYRSTYSAETGRFLAANWDKNVIQVMALAARSAAVVTGGVGGTVLTSATTLYKTSATDLAAGIYAAVQAFDEKDIPITSERNALVRPAQYYLLAQSTALVNRDWAEGNGNYGTGKILKIGGANIIKTNHLPSTNVNTGPTAYQGDFTKTAAVITTKEAVGTVKLLDLSMRMSYDERRLGTLIVSKYAVGHGILRSECAVELVTTT